MKIVFCLPGKNFSGNFLISWTLLFTECIRRGIDVLLSQKYNSNVYYVRAQCLGADVLKGENQKPFGGTIDYDYIMWIDSDQVFTSNDFFSLLSHSKDVVAGLYLMDGGNQYAAVEKWNEEYFLKNGSFEFLTPDAVNDRENSLIEVAYSGMGFMLVKKGVFENINYPWFDPFHFKFSNNISDFSSEDVSFCLKARKAGFTIYVDPNVVVGHEKSRILR